MFFRGIELVLCVVALSGKSVIVFVDIGKVNDLEFCAVDLNL